MNLRLLATSSADLDVVLVEWFRGPEYQHTGRLCPNSARKGDFLVLKACYKKVSLRQTVRGLVRCRLHELRLNNLPFLFLSFLNLLKPSLSRNKSENQKLKQ